MFNVILFIRLQKTLKQVSKEQDLFYLILIHDLIAKELIDDFLFFNSYFSIFDFFLKVPLVIFSTQYWHLIIFVLVIPININIIFFYLLNFRHLFYCVSFILISYHFLIIDFQILSFFLFFYDLIQSLHHLYSFYI